MSDGSVVSGNPIFTNILWNEIGRGADLVELRNWLVQNEKTIEEFTTAVFQTEAPRYLTSLPETSLDISAAKPGQTLFDQSCLKCHGNYRKNWNREMNPGETVDHYIQTIAVEVPQPTKVVNVGTDPQRAQAMSVLARGLNPLRISKEFGILIKPQTGYVPPPLVGIWARWPYFQNNSVPSLCAVLTPAPKRPTAFWTGNAKNPQTDFDSNCVGYPLAEKVPREWKADRSYLPP